MFKLDPLRQKADYHDQEISPRSNFIPAFRRACAVSALLALAAFAIACHVPGWGYHVHSTHSNTTHEEYCTDSNISEIDDEEWSNYVTTATSAPIVSWEAGIDTVLFVDRGDCDALSGSAFEDTEIHFFLEDSAICANNVYLACISPNFSCGNHTGSDYTHNNCDFLSIFFSDKATYKWHDVDSRNHLINHEVGHVLGLADPCSGASCEDVVNEQGTGCFFEPPLPILRPIPVVSIMHSSGYCCPPPGL